MSHMTILCVVYVIALFSMCYGLFSGADTPIIYIITSWQEGDFHVQEASDAKRGSGSYRLRWISQI